MLVAHVQLAAGGGVLRYAGRLQQHLVQRGVRALRQWFDRLLAQLIGAGPKRSQEILSCRIEGLVLPGYDLRLRWRRRKIGHDLRRPWAGLSPFDRRNHAGLGQDIGAGGLLWRLGGRLLLRGRRGALLGLRRRGWRRGCGVTAGGCGGAERGAGKVLSFCARMGALDATSSASDDAEKTILRLTREGRGSAMTRS